MQLIGVHLMLLALYRIRNNVVVAGLSLLLQTWKGSTISGIPKAKRSLSNFPSKNLFLVLLLAMAVQEGSWHGPLSGLLITPWASQPKRITPIPPVMVPQESAMPPRKNPLLPISPLISNFLLISSLFKLLQRSLDLSLLGLLLIPIGSTIKVVF